MFWLVLAAGVIGLIVYKKVSPESFWIYALWVLFIELLNFLFLYPFCTG